MANDFKEQFEEYTKYMHSQISKVAEYTNYRNFKAYNPSDKMGNGDFHRYKAGFLLSEKEFWNLLVIKNKVAKDLTNKIKKSLH